MVIVHEQPRDASAWKPRSTLLGSLLVHRYRLTQLLGQGSTGAVYRADDIQHNRPVAVRILAPALSQNMGLISRIRARIDEHARIEQQHPGALVNLVDAFDVGITLEGEVFVVTDFLDGDHLSTMLTRGGRLPWARARSLLVRLCQLIHELHGRGLLLGTLQARHCYAVRNRPKHEAIKILNTALIEHAAYNLGPAAGDAGVAIARYASPERLCGEPLDTRADVYSFGVIAYELLTGRVPFVGTNAIRLAAMHLQTPPLPPRQVAPDAGIPAAVEELILKALAKAPADRLASMEAFANAMLAVPEHEAAAPSPPFPGISPIAAAPVPPASPAAPVPSVSSPVAAPVPPPNLPGAAAPVPRISSPSAPRVAAPPLAPPMVTPPKLAPSVVMRGVVEQPESAPAPAPVPPPPAITPPRRPASIPVPAAVLPSLRKLSGPAPAAVPPVSSPIADKPHEAAAHVSVAAALAVEPPKDAAKPEPAATDKPTVVADKPDDKPYDPPAATDLAAADAPTTDKPADKPAAADKPSEPETPATPTTPLAAELPLAPVLPIAADKPAAPAEDKPAAAAATIVTPVLADRIAAARAAAVDKAAPADRSPETAKPAPAQRDVGFVMPPLVAAPAPERPQPAPARMSVAPAPAAPEVAPDELRAAALRQSSEHHPSLSQISDTSDSIIAELPRRRMPWFAVVGFGAAIAAGAAAYIQTQQTEDPVRGNAVQQAALTPTPGAVAEPTKLPPGAVASAEPTPPPTDRDAALEKLAADPAPSEPPPTDVPDEPKPTTKTEPAAEKPSKSKSEPKEKKGKKSRSKAVPEEEEEDVFDQLRKHMEAKKAAEDARAAAVAASQPPPPTPAPKIDGDSAAKAKDTLDRARQAATQGNNALAYSLAKQSYGLVKTTDALELMGMSACKAGNADNARSAANQLAGSRRSAIVDACAKNGITL